MEAEPRGAAEAPARVLAMIVAANGRVDQRELRALDELDAFRRMSVCRERFVELAETSVRQLDSVLDERSWLSLSGRMYLDRLLREVGDARRRLLVCRLGAAAITADGRVTRDERTVFEYTMANWHVSHMMVAHAIMTDRIH